MTGKKAGAGICVQTSKCFQRAETLPPVRTGVGSGIGSKLEKLSGERILVLVKGWGEIS